MSLPRWARLFVAMATALAAWLVAAPAHAAAPLCDRRGATVMAPAPQLQAPATSIDVGSREETCLEKLAHDRASIDHGRAPAPPSATVAVDLAVSRDRDRAPPGATLSSVSRSRDATRGDRPGVRSFVDRPPRHGSPA